MFCSSDLAPRFFFQAEDGIRDYKVTGVQTCALPICHALAEVLSRGDIHDPVIEGHMITVPEVAMPADLRLATIYVMPLGGRDARPVIEALERNKKFLRGEVARRINLKFAPDIRFRFDERFDEAERIEKIF